MDVFDDGFVEMAASPLAELHTARRTDAVADGEDEIEVVELDRALDLTCSLGLNC